MPDTIQDGVISTTGGEADFDINANLPPLYFSVGGTKVFFPAESIKTSYQNRIARHKRLYRDGARLDDIGALEEVFEVSGRIHQGMNWEPAVLEQGIAPYPDLVNKLAEAFRVHEVGDFMHPRAGLRRVRAESLEIVETADDRACAGYIAVFVEDNEEDADQRALKPDNGVTGFWAEFEKIKEKAAKDGVVEEEEKGLALQEADTNSSNSESYFQYATSYGNAVYKAAQSLGLAMEHSRPFDAENGAKIQQARGHEPKPVNQNRDPGSPKNHATHRRIGKFIERAALVRASAEASVGVTRQHVFVQPMSAFDVAQITGASLETIIAANPNLDMFSIPSGTPIVVPVTLALKTA